MHELPCGCTEEGCVCNNKVSVPNYVIKGSKVLCMDCINGKHKKSKKKPPKSTNMKETHKDMFVQTGGW